MKKQFFKISALALCGVFSLQILLPLFITIAIGFVQFSQEEFLSSHSADELAFEEVLLNKKDYEAALVNAKEIRLHGNLFDIHSVRKTGNLYAVKVFADEREDALDAISNTFSKEKKDAANILASLCFSLMYFENISTNLLIPEQTITFTDGISVAVTVNYFKVPTPPPNALA